MKTRHCTSNEELSKIVISIIHPRFVLVVVYYENNVNTISCRECTEPRWSCVSRRRSRILKWGGEGVNFCNNVIEPKPG